MYIKLDHYLSLFSKDTEAHDYWYDVGIVHAISLLENFSDKNWEELSENILEHTDTWILRCCEILDAGDIERSIPVGMKILKNKKGNNEIIVSALDSLNALLSSDFPLSSSEASFLCDLLDDTRKEAGKTEEILISSLYEKCRRLSS